MVEKLLLKKSKQGIAMIELIFALVIMGIVLMSAPMLIQQSIKSGNVALQQEAIAAAAAHTSMILSLHWDENNTHYQAGISPILATQNGISLQGLVGVIGRSSKDANNTDVNATPSTKLTSEGTEDINQSYDDVDDYNGKTVGLVVYTPAGGTPQNAEAELGDYVDVDLNISTEVHYTDDNITLANTVTQSTNIKFITVNLTSDSGIDELNKSITMKAFSCNIGTTAPQDRGEL